MPEYDDYQPATWSKGTFDDQRATYDANAGRGYADAVAQGVTASDLVPERISTDAKHPVVILFDQTGSMGVFPAKIYEKLGFLDHEIDCYFDGDYDVALGAFGDAGNYEKYPVQIRKFCKGEELQTELKELKIERNGGGNKKESSELASIYVDRNVDTPNAVKPLLIIITDEKAYDEITPSNAKKWSKVELKDTLTTKALFKSLTKKWSVYLIRKPYSDERAEPEQEDTRAIREYWENVLGKERMAFVPNEERLADVILGICANEMGKFSDYVKELEDRQLKDVGGKKKVQVALNAFKTIHLNAGATATKQIGGGNKSMKKLPGPDAHRSTMHRDPDTKSRPSKSLLDD